MKIVFWGTPDFAEKSLEAIYNAGFEIIGVVTNPDKPKGRGMKLIASPVKEFAIEHNLNLYQPARVRNNAEFFEEISSLKPELFCVVAYGKILPKEFLEIPKYGAINVHGSLLPKYRGAAPIQMAVINGEKETGVTTMFMDEGMDTGDTILGEKVQIGEDETTGELWDELSKVGAKLLVETVEKIGKASESNEIIEIEKKYKNANIEENKNIIADCKSNEEKNENSESDEFSKCQVKYKEEILAKIKELVGAKKQGEGATYAPMITKEMCKIDWNKTSEEINNLVRGLAPKIGAYTFYDEKKIKIWKTKVIQNTELENLIELKLENNIKNEINATEKNNNQYIEKNKNTNQNDETTKDNNFNNNEKKLAISNDEKENKIENGKVIFADKNNGIIVKTNDGAISILELQAENSKKMGIKDFLNGRKIEVNSILK